MRNERLETKPGPDTSHIFDNLPRRSRRRAYEELALRFASLTNTPSADIPFVIEQLGINIHYYPEDPAYDKYPFGAAGYATPIVKRLPLHNYTVHCRKPQEELIFTMTHEMCHIITWHLNWGHDYNGHDLLTRRERTKYYEQAENSTDLFARTLLAPRSFISNEINKIQGEGSHPLSHLTHLMKITHLPEEQLILRLWKDLHLIKSFSS